MHVGPWEVFHFPPTIHIWNAFPYPPPGDASNRGYMLPEGQNKHIREEMTITEIPSNSFEIIQIDTVGPLRISNGYRNILTMKCNLTKYIVAYPIETKDAKTIAKTLVEQFVLKYGCFKTLK